MRIRLKGFLQLASMVIVTLIMFGNVQVASASTEIQNNRELQYGAWIGSWPTAQGLTDFQNLQQRHLDVVNMFIDWNTDFDHIKPNFDAIYANNSIASLTWEAHGLSNADIRDGKKDNYIRQMAKDIKAYNKRMIIRLFHEANGNWYAWAVGDSKINTNETYVAAFRHVVDIFRQEGAANVKWDFNVNASSVGQGASYLGHYPGDDYVDIISIDGYNWGTTQSWSSWQSFDQIFSQAYNALKIKNKPMAISEFSSAEKGGDKAKWYEDAFNNIRSEKYNLINTVVCFNENKETDWRINSSESALEAFRKAINLGKSSNVEPEVRLGDVNDDGSKDAMDYIALQKYIMDSSNTINTKNADINGDNRINTGDLFVLKKLILE
ncbi:dockerin type I domain-containing protein [Clostridium saccharoperbutylacetonicum]|uniref:dockerin type I domain-containing protein n=1 Tax=Clostridium saccharoperbutylacetonicum TaxID=36745 RepID=UPI00156DB072|nr:dockerin type I domain-containing protein [Clostridium saccharoperbutylacetonicum]NSB30200.1 endoglucanase [Clostridium saccharoperbutylacetonicum]